MKRIFLLLIAFLTISCSLQAQLQGKLKKVMELKMPMPSDDKMKGTRGACVVWHPVQKKYYAVMAGNEGYPLAVFDMTGKRLSDDELTAIKDTRGLWYDPVTKQINGNGYDETGWFKYVLDNKGIPIDATTTLEGSHQPDVQSVGSYHPLRKQVMFLYDGKVSLYTVSTGTSDEYVQINWGRKKSEGKSDEETQGTPEAYNYTSVVYTGIRNAELGFLNTGKKQIELYDLLSGFMTKIIPLPDDAPIESSFNFAYTNGIYWLFNISERKWQGYR